MGHGKEVHLVQRQLRVFQHILRHGQQGTAVGQAAALAVLREQAAILHQGHGRRPGRRFKSKDQHSSAPSMVIFLSVSFSFSMRTTTSSPKKASCTFSLHSTAQTAPRLR